MSVICDVIMVNHLAGQNKTAFLLLLFKALFCRTSQNISDNAGACLHLAQKNKSFLLRSAVLLLCCALFCLQAGSPCLWQTGSFLVQTALFLVPSNDLNNADQVQLRRVQLSSGQL